MKHLFLICMCVLSFAFAKAEPFTATFFQEFISHQVTKGETLYSIAKKYNLKEKEIVKLNPDAKDRVYEGLVLILPASASTSTETTATAQEDIRFKTHKVRRKETLYSISKKYDVTQDVIKKYNKRLYSETLRKGDKIRIPLNYVGVVEEKVTITNTGGGISQDDAPKDGGPAYTSYVVQPKETKYGIARLYGITIAELEAMNPEMKDGLQLGQTIRVPNTQLEKTDTAAINEDLYAFYEVKKGNTIYSLLKQFDITADTLVTLNPAIADGLKEGMILKVPKGVSGTITGSTGNEGNTVAIVSETTKTSLLDSLSDFSTKKIVLMLPFGLTRTTADSLSNAEDVIKNDRALRISLDFHSGVLLALEKAKQQGISTDLKVYDTEYVRGETATNARKVERIITENDFSDVDVVIGPLLSSNFNRASSLLATQNIPLISPLTQREVDFRSNVFQSRPSEAQLRAVMLDYIKERADGKNIVVIADKKNSKIKSKLQSLFPNAKMVTFREGDNGPYLGQYDISDKISEFQENWVILETNDVPIISSATTKLATLLTSRKVTLFTTYKGTAYDSDAIQHMDLMHLNFHFPSMNKEYDYTSTKEFVDTYQDLYKITPSEEAIRGYDITYDTLLRLAFAKNLYDAASTGIETSYIENKFRYDQKSSGGFYNNAIYLMKYSEGLMLEEITISKISEVMEED